MRREDQREVTFDVPDENQVWKSVWESEESNLVTLLLAYHPDNLTRNGKSTILRQGPTKFSFQQVDVFASQPLRGNPLAVVIGAETLTDSEMAAFANWTNLSETTFLLQPRTTKADYRVRIFTPVRELPFAGHPTLGSCHVWLASGGKPRGDEITGVRSRANPHTS